MTLYNLWKMKKKKIIQQSRIELLKLHTYCDIKLFHLVHQLFADNFAVYALLLKIGYLRSETKNSLHSTTTTTENKINLTHFWQF